MIARAGGSLFQMPELSTPFSGSDPDGRRGATRAWRAVLCFTLAVLALSLVVSCTRPLAPVELVGGAQAYPPKPTPKPRLGPVSSYAPAGAVTVAPGDTVYGIARRFGVPIRTIIEANDLSPPYTLRVGQRLALADRAEVSTGALAPASGADLGRGPAETLRQDFPGLPEPWSIHACSEQA